MDKFSDSNSTGRKKKKNIFGKHTFRTLGLLKVTSNESQPIVSNLTWRKIKTHGLVHNFGLSKLSELARVRIILRNLKTGHMVLYKLFSISFYHFIFITFKKKKNQNSNDCVYWHILCSSLRPKFKSFENLIWVLF